MILTPFENIVIESSFRDPSGFLFRRNNQIYRQVNTVYQLHYDYLMQSGLYENLVQKELLIPHIEVDMSSVNECSAYKIIQPDIISFISYPYEWCFSQLKRAALVTLHIQKEALKFNMTLKDASAYNIQIYRGKPILIDTLSFEKYREGMPWIAYKQFCQHFLAPLALMALTDVRLNQLTKIYIDGIPLDLASVLLPKRSWIMFGIFLHIHLHSKSQKQFGDKIVKVSQNGIRKTSLIGILNSLKKAIQKLEWKTEGSEWGDYYRATNYSQEGMYNKKEIVLKYLNEIHPKSVWDLGANTGLFSRLASEKEILTVSFDMDPLAVEKNYQEVIRNNEQFNLPLCLNLTNPSPRIGWGNAERASLLDRGPVDVIFALALIHHLSLSNNLPLEKIASFFNKLCRYLIIEFVPKSDSHAQRLLKNREDIFPQYTEINFENAFSFYFEIQRTDQITNSDRKLYLLKRKGNCLLAQERRKALL